MSHVIDKKQVAREAILTYSSRAPARRPAYALTIIFLCATGIFTGAIMCAGVMTLLQPSPYSHVAIVAVMIAAALFAYLVVYTRGFILDFSKRYIFEVTDNEIRLKILDDRSGRAFIARMPVDEISFVEHFTPRDYASLVFHGTDERIIEVPIWSMMDDPAPILEFLSDKNVKTVRV